MAAVVGVAGGQKLKNKITIEYTQAVILTAMPKTPRILNRPQETPTVPCISTRSEGDLMNPVQRSQRKSPQEMRYVEYRLLMVRETTSLKATAEPIFISPRRQETVAVKMTVAKGIEVRELTYQFLRNMKCSEYQPSRVTLLSVRQNGRPRSRANAQYILDEDATIAKVLQISNTVTIAIIVELPPIEPVASRKTAMNGY